jgi:O-antigen/teichoic acid export membrane protein
MVSYVKGDFARMNLLLGRGVAVTAMVALPSLLAVVLAAVFAQALFGLPADVVRLGRKVILLSGAITILGLVTSVWNAAVFMTERFYIQSVASVMGTLLSAAGAVALFSFTRPSITAWVLLSGGTGLLVTWFFTIPWACRGLPQLKIVPYFGKLNETSPMLRLSLASFLGGLSYLLYYATDSIIISNLEGLGPAKIFTYSVGQRWDPMIRGVLVAFATTLQPAMIALVAARQNNGIRRMLFRATRYCMLAGLLPCLLLAAFSDPFIRCWVGPSFVQESGPVLRWLMIGVVFSIPTIVGYEILVAMACLREMVVASLIGGVLNIVLSIFLAKYAGMGVLGVALGTMIALTLKNTLYMPWLVSSKLGISLFDYTAATYVRPLCCLVPASLLAVAFRLGAEPEGWPMLMMQMGVCAVVYGVSVWTVGLTREDRDKIYGSFWRILKRASR